MYLRLVARLLAAALADEAASQGVTSFSGGVTPGHDLGLIGEHTAAFVAGHAGRLDALVAAELEPGADRPAQRTSPAMESLEMPPPSPREVVPPPGTTPTAALITKCGCRTSERWQPHNGAGPRSRNMFRGTYSGTIEAGTPPKCANAHRWQSQKVAMSQLVVKQQNGSRE
jgi:hypothetical protein